MALNSACVSGELYRARLLVEELAEQIRWARDNNIPLEEFIPDWKNKGKAAGVMRNTDIVNACDRVLAFPSRNGKGTQDTIKKASKKQVITIFID